MSEQQKQQATAVTVDDGVESQLDRMLEKIQHVRGHIGITADGVSFGDFEGVQRYARLLVEAGLVPPQKDEQPRQQLARATACILLGRNVGLTPEQSVQSIYVVNGRPQLFGDAPLAIARQHPLWDESGFREYWVVNGKEQRQAPAPEEFRLPGTTAVCVTLRKGASEPYISTFSIADAKQAGLLGGRNQALYGAYPQRMLKFRARGYCLRDNFGDALKGIGIRELHDARETEPIPAAKVLGPDPLAERLNAPAPAAATTGVEIAVQADMDSESARQAAPAAVNGAAEYEREPGEEG